MDFGELIMQHLRVFLQGEEEIEIRYKRSVQI